MIHGVESLHINFVHFNFLPILHTGRRRMHLSAGTWDTHLHCLDPAHHPFKATRSYTPMPAPLDILVKEARTERIVLVQASIENGHQGLKDHLRRIRTEYPHILARGIICLDESWPNLTNDDIDELQHLGVRYCRIHGYFGHSGSDSANLEKQFQAFARSYPAQKWGWGISAQLPLATWSSLRNLILDDPEVSRIPIIADHVGCASPADINSVELETFVNLLHARRLYVKISCLYRRSKEINEMKPIIQKLAENAPHALLWGSDWPHVDSTNRASNVSLASKQEDIEKEVMALQRWLSEVQWKRMLVENPERLFGK
jgi:predicted TIM-barrel fold metal-dependent hydrolase